MSSCKAFAPSVGSTRTFARILTEGRGALKNPVEATKWHLISKARGETDLTLDDFVDKLDPATQAAGEKAAEPWVAAVKEPKG